MLWREREMTKYIPLGDVELNLLEKRLTLKGGHLEEGVGGELSVTNGDTTVYGEIEVKSDGSYELIENGLSLTDLTFQEKLALQDRLRKQWEDSDKNHKYYKRQEIKRDIIDISKIIGFILGASAFISTGNYLANEVIKYFSK